MNMQLKVNLSPGIYVVAVSGGVDSMVLLSILNRPKNLKLVVAHFDHGIREDSRQDAKLVKKAAKSQGHLFELGQGGLGLNTSEAVAREARYKFLHQIKNKYKANAIITAHHQDDLIETSMINVLRGTGRKGLTSLKSRDDILRPLLKFSKKQLESYAKSQKIKWHEDSTNKDIKHLRNYLRIKVIPKMTPEEHQKWLDILNKVAKTNDKLDIEIQKLLSRGLHKNQLVLSRKWFATLPHDIAKEVIVNILSKANISGINRKSIERLTIQIKTLPAGKVLQAPGVDIQLTKRSARLKIR